MKGHIRGKRTSLYTRARTSRTNHALSRDKRELESDSEPESEASSDDEGSTYRYLPGSTTKDRTTAAPIRRSPSTHRRRVAVTDTDLRAMALYRFEKGDGPEIRRYGTAAWREFGHRPEVSYQYIMVSALLGSGETGTEPYRYRSLEPAQANIGCLDLHPAKAGA